MTNAIWSHAVLLSAAAAALALFGHFPAAQAQDAYKAAVPALNEAGGPKTCVSCFLERYGPAEEPKAFAVSKDGAYGGRWNRQSSIDQVKKEALESCRKKPEFNAANPCVIFFENDKQVWRP